MQSNSHPTEAARDTRAEHAQARTRVIAITRGAANDIHDELCDSLLGALADGVREIVLDLPTAERITAGSWALMEAAGATLADRGGVLLVLTGGHGEDGPAVMREIQGEMRETPEDGTGVPDSTLQGETGRVA
jgi:hypothetical protein